MKRQNPDNNNQFGSGGPGQNKRHRADPYNEALSEGKFELRMLIPTKAAGAVIGKGGEYIKSVREKVGVFALLYFWQYPFGLALLASAPPPKAHNPKC